MHKPGHGPGAAPRIIALSNGDTLNEGRYRIDRELNREFGGLAQRRDGFFLEVGLPGIRQGSGGVRQCVPYPME